MDSQQAPAGEYAGSTANLEAIARHYAGEDVRVQWQPSSTWLGLARRTAGGYEILLNPVAAAGDLGFIFFHELGHLVSGHCENVTQRTPAEMAHVDPWGPLERMGAAERGACGAAIDAREAAADSWAYNALAAFEGRFGPFLKAIR